MVGGVSTTTVRSPWRTRRPRGARAGPRTAQETPGTARTDALPLARYREKVTRPYGKTKRLGGACLAKVWALNIKCLFVSKSVSARATHSARAVSEYSNRESGTERESEGRGSAGREAGPAARGLSLWLIIAKDTLEQPIHAPC